MKNKQSQVCDICCSYMQYHGKNQEYLKCPTCGNTKKVTKKIIIPKGLK